MPPYGFIPLENNPRLENDIPLNSISSNGSSTLIACTTTKPTLKLERSLGLFSGTAIVMGSVIGSGVFSTPSIILNQVGSPGMSIIIWVVGALVSFFGCMAFVELGTMLPRSGGEKEYLNVAYPRPRALLSFSFCITSILIMNTSSLAANNIITATYTLYAADGSQMKGSDSISSATEWKQKGIAIFALLLSTCMHSFFPVSGIRVQNTLTLVKVLTLLFVVVVGIIAICGGLNIDSPHNFSSSFSGTSRDPSSYSSAMFDVYFTYSGYYSLNYVIDELKNPTRNLPLASFGGLLIVSILYIITNIAYFAVLPIDMIKQSDTTVAGVFFSYIFGKTWGQRVIPAFIALSAFGQVMCGTFTNSRIIFEAAREGYLPFSTKFGTPSRFNTPLYALALNAAVTFVYIVAPPHGEAYDLLLKIGGYPTWVYFGLAVAGLLTMRRTHKYLARPFKAFLPTTIIVVAVSIFMCTVPFLKPYQESVGKVPYWVAPLVGLVFILATFALWFVQIVMRRGLEKSYNSQQSYRSGRNSLDLEEDETI